VVGARVTAARIAAADMHAYYESADAPPKNA